MAIPRRSPAAVLLLACLLAACSAETKEAELTAASGSAQPHLARGPGSSIVLSWLEPAADQTLLRFSVFDGDAWTQPATVASGSNWFVNWADFPSVSAINDTTLAAHWLRKQPGGVYVYDVYASISTDAGASWGEPFVVHNDGTASEHGFVSLFPWQDGIGALWLDGRNTSGSGDHAAHSGGMALRSAKFSSDGTAAERVEIDNLVCDCCSTDVAIASTGPIAVYRDRTEDEIRDIAVARMIDGVWQPGERVAADNWEISGCPVNGPAVDARSEAVVVAWFTAAHSQPLVRLARSADSGASFAPPITIDDDAPIGRVDVALLDDGRTIVSWLGRTDDGGGALKAMFVSPDGRPGKTTVIASTGVGRTSGFPQMVVHGNTLVFAWTDILGEETRVRTRVVRIGDLS